MTVCWVYFLLGLVTLPVVVVVVGVVASLIEDKDLKNHLSRRRPRPPS